MIYYQGFSIKRYTCNTLSKQFSNALFKFTTWLMVHRGIFSRNSCRVRIVIYPRKYYFFKSLRTISIYIKRKKPQNHYYLWKYHILLWNLLWCYYVFKCKYSPDFVLQSHSIALDSIISNRSFKEDKIFYIYIYILMRILYILLHFAMILLRNLSFKMKNLAEKTEKD